MNRYALKHLSFIWLILLSICSMFLFFYYPNVINHDKQCSVSYIFNNYSLEKIGFVEIFNQIVLYKNVVLSSMFLFACGYIYISKYYSPTKLLLRTSLFLFLYVAFSMIYIVLSHDSDIFYSSNSAVGCLFKYLFFNFLSKYNFFSMFFVSFFAIFIYLIKNKNFVSNQLNKYISFGVLTYFLVIISTPGILFVDYCRGYISSRTIVSLPSDNVHLKEISNVKYDNFNHDKSIKIDKRLIYSMSKSSKWNIHVQDLITGKFFDFEFMTMDKSKDIFVDVARLENHVVIACKEGIYYFDLNNIPQEGKLFTQEKFNQYLRDEYTLISGDVEIFYDGDNDLNILYVAGKRNIYIDHYILTSRGLEPISVHVFNNNDNNKDYHIELDHKFKPHFLYIMTNHKTYLYNIYHKGH